MKSKVYYAFTLLFLTSLVVNSRHLIDADILAGIDMQIKLKETAFFASSLNVTKTDEICPSNGTINATVTGQEPDATVVFEYWNTANPGNVITTTMPISGLGAGNYVVRAIITGTVIETLEEPITITKLYQPIQASTGIDKVTCVGENDGKVTVNITQGTTGNKYILISAPASYTAHHLPYTQTTNVFTDLTEGVYQIQVFDTCNLYNTITATVATKRSYDYHYAYFRPNATNCDQATVGHEFSRTVGGDFRFPMIITTSIIDVTNNVIIGTKTDTVNPALPPGSILVFSQPMTLTTADYDYPLVVNVTTTDACGTTKNHTYNKRSEIYLEGVCPPESGFNWDIRSLTSTPSYDWNAHAVWPLTISWVNTANPADSGSQTTPVGQSPANGRVTGLTVGAEYNVTITDDCGHVRSATIVSGAPANAGQTAYIRDIPACSDGKWILQAGTDPAVPGNVKITSIKVLSAPATATWLTTGTVVPGNPTLWEWTGSMDVEGDYTFEVSMGCVVDTITVNAKGGGIKMLDPVISPSITCNTSNVDISYSWLQGGAEIPVPVVSGYNTSLFRFALSDINLLPGEPNPFDYQANTLFENVPNGTYKVIMNTPRSTSTECIDKVIGLITVTNRGPVINSPFGYYCKSADPATPFGVIVDALGTGTLQYAITSISGVPVSPVVWQPSDTFENLAAGVYTIEVRDNCASTATTFSTYTIAPPRVSQNGICPGQPGSLITTFAPGYVYQWYKNDVLLTDTANITGTTTNQLHFAVFNAPADEGEYKVHITYGTCIDDFYSIIISNATPQAGGDVTTTVCYTQPVKGISLDDLLTATAQPNGDWVQVSANGGTLIGNIFDPTGIDPSNGPFEFKYTVKGYCGATDEAMIQITFTETAVPGTTATTQVFCAADAPTLASLQATGDAIQWYETPISATPLVATTPLTDGTTYYATQTVAGCESFRRLAITVQLVAAPDITLTVSDIELCLGTAPYTTTISNAQSGYIYEIVDAAGKPLVPTVSAEGTNADLILEIPATALPATAIDYTIRVHPVGLPCTVVLTDVLHFSTSAPDTTLRVIANGPLCEGIDGTITIGTSQPSVSYQVLQGGIPLVPAIIGVGSGADLILTLPAGLLVKGGNDFTIVASGIGCTDAVLATVATIIVNPTIKLVTKTAACIADGSGYVIKIKIDGTAPFTATGTGAPGNWTGNVWTSELVPAGTDYVVQITDMSTCEILTVADTAPVCCTLTVTCPTDITVECGSSLLPDVTGSPVIVVSCGNPNITYTDGPLTGGCSSATGTFTRTFTISDTSGNSTLCTQSITLQDTKNPVFEGVLPGDLYVECDKLDEAPILEATDNCSAVEVVLIETTVPGECSNRSTLQRTWTATDACGNQTMHTQRIHMLCKIEVFNAVSSVENGMNDILRLEGIDCYPNNTVTIFNRWGVEVFQTSGYNNTTKVFNGYSDGRSTISRNEKLPTGTYFYILKYELNQETGNTQNIEQSGYLYIN